MYLILIENSLMNFSESSTWGALVKMDGILASSWSEWYLSRLEMLISSQQLLTLLSTFHLSNMSSETVNIPGVCL